MALNLSKLKSITRRLKKGSHSGREPSSFGTWKHLREDWETVFTLFIIINIASLAVGVLLFLSITSGGLSDGRSAQGVEINTFKKQELTEQLELFENKNDRFIEILESSVTIPDPSR